MPQRTLLRGRPERIAGRAAGLLGLLLTLGATGWAEDPPLPAPFVLAAPETDASGRLEALVHAAEQEQLAGRPEQAADRLAEAFEAGADVPVALPSPDEERAALRWPVARVIERIAATLPPEARARLALRIHGGATAVASRLAQEGDVGALERLARAPVLEAAGLEALALLGDRALEQGDPATALDHLRRWEALAPPAGPGADARGAVALRIVTALALVGDQEGLARRAAAPAQEGGDPEPVATRVAAEAGRRLAALRAREGAPATAAPPAAPLPAALSLAWSRVLTDPDLRGAPPEPRDLVTEAVAADAEMTLLHDGRRVRRLDTLTGRERWVFPRAPLGWEHDPFAKYEPHDRPLRCVERHGDLVLAVIGDPGGTGAYAQGELQLDIDTGTRESRARLVALDAATGALRWHTGALREAHPVLGDRATCCASPPLVVGDVVYVLFARRFGVAEVYAACLELATGRPRWVRFLAAGENGRDPGVSAQGGRDERARVRAVPWGQRPALAEGELCVVPQAGFAAGLEPGRGTLAWVRALPRFRPAEAPSERRVGASARNEPLAVPGAWVIAPMDAPMVLALERGSGRLRWHTAPFGEGLAPVWRDLLGLARDAQGRPVIRVVGAQPATLHPFHGALLAAGAPFAQDDPDGATFGGRPCDLGDGVGLLEQGVLRVRPWPGPEGPLPADLPLEGDLPGPGGASAPAWGDVVRAGATWLVVEPQRVSAWLDRDAAPRLLGEAQARAREDAALLATAAAVRSDGEAVAAAVERLGSDPGAAPSVARDLVRLLRAGPEAVEVHAWRAALAWRLRAGLAGLPSPEREQAYLAGLRALRQTGRLAEAVALLGDWIDAPLRPAADLVAPEGLGAGEGASGEARVLALRCDLAAGRMLRALRAQPEAAAALAEREQQVAARIEAARQTGDATRLGEALRTAVGTRALARAREDLALAAAAAGDAARAARLAADLRLDPGEPPAGGEAAARARAARWQLGEAGWLAQAGDVEGARALLEELRRWVPSGTADAQGRTTSALLEALRAEHGWAPERGRDVRPPLDFWPGETGPLQHDRRGSIRVPSLTGPGAGRSRDRFLLCRGLDLEVWSLAAGARVATLPSGDGGWFGGTLQDATPWLAERGVRVVTTVAGEPADRSGFRSGDWLLTWDGAPVDGMADLMRRIAASEPGRALEVTLVRDGETRTQAFTPGRRPVAEARDVLERPRAWADADGRVLLPTRVGVLRVDLASGAAEPFWSYGGVGTVQSLTVCGGQALVGVRRMHADDLLVALDPRDGRERWRADLPGPIEDVEASGSALVVRLGTPARLVLLDAEDGTTRARLTLVEPLRLERRAVLAERTTAGTQAGRVFALLPAGGPPAVLALNSTTLEVRVTPVEGGRRNVPFGFGPQLAVGAYVALLQGPGLISVLEPDPLGLSFTRLARIQDGELLTEQLHHGGELDHESRVVLQGETLYVLRYQPRHPGSTQRGVTVMTFGRIDDARGRLRFTLLDHEPPASRALGELYVTHLEAHPDGLLVSVLTRTPGADGAHARSVLWVPSAEGGALERSGSPPPWEVSAVVPRRAAPARVGGALLLLTDAGARALPLGAVSGR